MGWGRGAGQSGLGFRRLHVDPPPPRPPAWCPSSASTSLVEAGSWAGVLPPSPPWAGNGLRRSRPFLSDKGWRRAEAAGSGRGRGSRTLRQTWAAAGRL